MRTRHGFTIMELLVVMVVGTIMLAVVAPNISRALTLTRVQRAAAVVAADLQLAHTLAARQRVPVRITIDPASYILRVHRGTTPDTVFSVRRLDGTSEYPLDGLVTSSTSVTVFPNGMASGPLRMTLQAGGSSRVVSMTRVGQVRVR
jgi:prepilin-type N-terminal cleavage/methylation domain-containing protein